MSDIYNETVMEEQDNELVEQDLDTVSNEDSEGRNLSKGEIALVAGVAVMAGAGVVYTGKQVVRGAKWVKGKAGAMWDSHKEKKLKKEAEKNKSKTENSEPVADVEYEESE